ncbi:MAG: GTPase [Candidatus Thorarchaeota archaeon]|jgi:ribosome-interacting GTPase 1
MFEKMAIDKASVKSGQNSQEVVTACRCVNVGLFVSGDLRRDVTVSFAIGQRDNLRVISFPGPTLRRVSPDERSISFFMLKAIERLEDLEVGRSFTMDNGIELTRVPLDELVEAWGEDMIQVQIQSASFLIQICLQTEQKMLHEESFIITSIVASFGNKQSVIILPTNVTPEFDRQRIVYEETEDLAQRIVELEKLLSLAPRHKGGERMVGDYRKKLATLKATLEKRKEQERARKSSAGAEEGVVRKEGAGQVCLVGVTNCGKSSIINAVTNAEFDVGDYPFTTPIPTPAMLTLQDINIQLVELPGMFVGSHESGIGRQSLAVARNTDCIALVIDLSQDIDNQMNIILGELDKARIRLNKEKTTIRIERVGMGGQMLYGIQNYQGDIEEVREYLKARRITNIIVRFQKPATFEQLIDAMDASVAYVRAMVVATKGDSEGSEARFKELEEKYSDRFDIIPVSVESNENLDGMSWAFYEHLDILRVYTKIPGKRREAKPIVLPEGSVVEDAALKVHKELFVERFRSAVILRENDKIKRRTVGLNYPLEDGDILQLAHR